MTSWTCSFNNLIMPLLRIIPCASHLQ
uniref:Uncharacterized protein n=1 Tax=Anguilla anguilla TaxID=7936 RepID=A0A0E9V6V4_ANGAN